MPIEIKLQRPVNILLAQSPVILDLMILKIFFKLNDYIILLFRGKTSNQEKCIYEPGEQESFGEDEDFGEDKHFFRTCTGGILVKDLKSEQQQERDAPV